MAGLDEIRIDLDGIAHVLSDNKLLVPTFQRSFAWEVSHVADLLTDVENAIREHDKEYFLGSIVVSTERSGMLEVVDGQQRLATIAILLSGIRDYLLANNENGRADTLETDYLLKRDLRTEEPIPRLSLNETDNDFFRRKILSRPGSPDRSIQPSRSSHIKLEQATIEVGRHISSITANSGSPVDLLLDFVDYLRNSTKVILVKVPDHANAFTIFETLNDRGLDLAISDLLKNYLLYRADNRHPEVQTAWAAMMGALSAAPDEASIVDFLRHFWASRNGATRERDLYLAIRKRITSKQSAIDLSHDLETAARRYAGILTPSHELWSEYGPSARQHAETIGLLRMSQVRPLLLAMLDKFSAVEVKKALRLIVSMGVRFLVHGGLGGGVMERHYSDRAVEIQNGEISTSTQLSRAMRKVVPTDAAFESAFSLATVSQAHLARYYLRALEKQAAGESQPELVPNPNEEEVTLEHVLPVKPESNWPDFTEEEARVYFRRIGNMVLLQQRMNSSLKSESYAKKKPILSKSKFRLTSSVATQKKWTRDEIEKRQAELAKLAVKTWSL